MKKTLIAVSAALVLASGSTQAADLAREARIASQIEDAILDGEPVRLQAGEVRFLAIYTPASTDETRGAAVILHGSEVWVAYWQLSTGVDASNFDNYWAYGVVMLVTAVVITLIFGAQNLSRKQERIKYQET